MSVVHIFSCNYYNILRETDFLVLKQRPGGLLYNEHNTFLKVYLIIVLIKGKIEAAVNK